jgi:hypothetical protein
MNNYIMAFSSNTYTLLHFIGNKYKYNRNIHISRQLKRSDSFIEISSSHPKKKNCSIDLSKTNVFTKEDFGDLYN